MPKVFGLHQIALRPGVKGEDFEKFMIEEVYPLPEFEGWKTFLLKGDRGDREGKYLVMMEIESVEARDRYAPAPDQMTAEAEKFMKIYGPVFEKWATLATPVGEGIDIYTDYVVVGK